MNNKQAVYEAEHEVTQLLDLGGTVEMFGSTIVLPQEMRFGDIAGVQRYLEKASAHVGFDRVPTVRERKGQRFAHYEPRNNVIAVPPHLGSRHSWGMREVVVLHELSHAIAWAHGHDAVFCATLVDLVSRCIAPEAGFLFRVAYGERGVQVGSSAV